VLVHLRTSAVAALLVLGLASCGGSDPDGSVVEPAPDVTAAPEPTEAGADVSPEEAFLSFVRAAAEGRTDDGYALLAASSQAAVGGPEGFAGLSTELAEGFGAFAGASPQLLRTELGDGGVLTVAAPVEREGMSELATEAVPYRVEDGAARLELFDRAPGQVELVAPPTGGRMSPGGPIEVEVPAADDVVLALDGVALAVQSETSERGGQRLHAQAPDELLDDRVYVLTVAWVDAEGRFGGAATSFTTG
jgi:hypothetical protein